MINIYVMMVCEWPVLPYPRRNIFGMAPPFAVNERKKMVLSSIERRMVNNKWE